jgi:hypothetical protein
LSHTQPNYLFKLGYILVSVLPIVSKLLLPSHSTAITDAKWLLSPFPSAFLKYLLSLSVFLGDE